jgi:hypothetical protein
MAFLLDAAARRCIPLAPHHTFGRLAHHVDTYVDNAYVSKLHAAIEWNGLSWRIKNLGQNGTWLNGNPLAQGETRALAEGDVFYFAEQHRNGFTVVNVDAPADVLWPSTNDPIHTPPITLSRHQLLPNTENPDIALYFDDDIQAWMVEELAAPLVEPRVLDDGDEILIAGNHWRLVRFRQAQPTDTKISRQLQDYEFCFRLSLDEESTELQLVYQGTIDLGVRTHHYLLAQLARHRALSIQAGQNLTDQGWIYADQLANELGLDSTHMNIQIFRARKQLSEVLPTTLGQHILIERRGGKLRFGCPHFTIYKGGHIEFSSLTSPATADA